MGLELGQILVSLRQAASELRTRRREGETRLKQALSLYPSLGDVKVGGKSTWLVAGIEEGRITYGNIRKIV
ncbi:MAG: hypothetical protein AAB037_00600, partial [Chloroflexota bacterium]